ncbi:MAG TPA: hypothetical protein VG148_17310 [Pyrinomonadaceae bacterium]|nr:hypothetical protein [Pyrinomonadaceae bacterium]
MKHRSTHIFILLAAVMIAAPQVSRELSALKDAVGRRVKAEIINAFLDLQAGAVTRPAQPSADNRLAARGAGEEEPSAQQARPATHVEVHARREVPAELPSEAPGEVVMLTGPLVELAAAQPEPPPAPDYKFELHDVKDMRGRELAMLGPPERDLAQSRAQTAARREANEARRTAARRKRAERQEAEAASFAWRFAEAGESEGEAEARGKLEALRLLGVDLRQVAPRIQTKVLKAKPAAKPAAPAPPPRRACPTRQVACGPSGPETLFVGE